MAEYPHHVARRFGENLRRCHRRAGVSQEELAGIVCQPGVMCRGGFELARA